MMGMEKMIAQMLGLTPEKMNEMVGGFQTLLNTLNSRLETIEVNQKKILDTLERIENGGNNSGRNQRGKSLESVG